MCPTLKKTLFAAGNRANYSTQNIEQDQIKKTIFEHPEFAAFSQTINNAFIKWKTSNLPKLNSIAVGDKPKQFIYTISEDLLQCFAGLPLIDNYDVYQNHMTYWVETMQDDVYALVDVGWEAGREIEKGNKKNEWEGRLIPKQLIINRYFTTEQLAIENREADRDTFTRQMKEMEEEHSGEEGLLEESKNDKGKLTKTSVQNRIKEIKDDEDYADELAVLVKYKELIEHVAEANKKIKEVWATLEKKVLEKYKVLSIDDIITLVVEDKWLARIEQDVHTEMQRISQRLTGRIKELAERYENTLPKLEKTVDELEDKVDTHLGEMGFVWK